jgi:hypothetical protein
MNGLWISVAPPGGCRRPEGAEPVRVQLGARTRLLLPQDGESYACGAVYSGGIRVF